MRSKLLLVVTAAILTVTLGPGADAATQKKVTSSQAWKICKEDVDKAVPKSADHATQRYMRAGSLHEAAWVSALRSGTLGGDSDELVPRRDACQRAL